MLVLDALLDLVLTTSDRKSSAVIAWDVLVVNEQAAAGPRNQRPLACGMGRRLLEGCGQRDGLDVQLSWKG
jgi:hypothetical protein